MAKTSHNAFTTTNLQQLLTEAGIREVDRLRHPDRAVRGDHRPGRRPTSATDDVRHRRHRRPSRSRTGTLPETATVAEILADPRTLSTRRSSTRTEYALAGRFATIRTVDELRRSWAPLTS